MFRTARFSEPGYLIEADSVSARAFLKQYPEEIRAVSLAHGVYEVADGVPRTTLRRFFPARPVERNQALSLWQEPPIAGCLRGRFQIQKPVALQRKARFYALPSFVDLQWQAEGDIDHLNWRILAPTFSRWGNELRPQPTLRFKPDSIGGYRVQAFVRDTRCYADEIKFVVSHKPPYRYLPPRAEKAVSRHLQLTGARSARSRGQGILLAFLDTGVHYGHPGLASNVAMAGNAAAQSQGWDFIFQDPDPYDDHGHGTMMASLAASSAIGVAPQAQILPVKVIDAFGHSDVATVIAGIYYAVDQHAQVITLALGYSPDQVSPLHSRALKRAFEHAEAHNVLILLAAGNSQRDLDRFPLYPSVLQSENVIVVGAASSAGLASYSNYGARTVTTLLPGGDRDEPFVGLARENPKGAVTTTAYGTSMAAALAAGSVGLGLSLKPGLPYRGIREALLSAGDESANLRDQAASSRVVDLTQFLQKL